jgi:excinuclease ABC subunit C
MSETHPQPPDDEQELPTATPGSRPSGPDVILGYLKTLPSSPGVYRMIDAAGDVIYVGKARSLKARVSNYARLNGNSNRIVRMILSTVAMEFVTVRTEAEALLLEANLIKRFRPRYNVLMRDDKSFPYILIATDHKAPQISKHRGARNRKGHFFGPFASAGAVNRTVNMLQRAFLLRTCTDSVFEARTRPCLLYQIKRCAGPCTGEISPEDYAKLVDESVQFLRGESQNVRQMYQRLMTDAADKLEFEEAAKFRNRLWALAHVTADQTINPEGIEEADVFAAVQEGGQTCIQVFFFRTGQNWGNRAYYPRADRTLGAAEVLDAFIAQFYDDKPVPRLILISHEVPSQDLLSEALSIKAERRIDIRCPQRGNKTGLVEHAMQNAREALARKLAETSSQKLLLAGVAERFGLAKVPRRIEVYDNSHISGTNAVGGMIVAGPEGMVKNQYRKFNIKSDAVTPGDDYAMMREVFTRRFKRVAEELRGAAKPEQAADADLQKPSSGFPEADPSGARTGNPGPLPAEDGLNRALPDVVKAPDIGTALLRGSNSGEPELGEPQILDETETDDDDADDNGTVLDTSAFPTIPDLILVDGGAGQLAVARDVLAEFGLTNIIPIVGIAKGPDRDAGREHFHVPGQARSFMLEPRDPVLYFVQRLRDEAHRFAIGTHRAKRAKALGVNPLDEIEGIGPTRKRALLTHFGSAKSVSRAGIEDLKAVPGISAQMAQAIYDFFHDGKGEDSRGTRSPDA